MEYKIVISSADNDLDALKAEYRHAKGIVEKLQTRDLEFDTKHHKMSSQRVWLKDRIVEWSEKTETLNAIIIDFKAQEKIRKRKVEWARIKAEAGYGRGGGA